MKYPLLSVMRHAQGFMRTTCWTVLVAYISVFYTPSAKAIQHGVEQGAFGQETSATGEVNAILENLHRDVQRFDRALMVKEPKAETLAMLRERIADYQSALHDQDDAVRDELDAMHKDAEAKKLAQLKVQAESMLAAYESGSRDLHERLADLDDETDIDQIRQAVKSLDQQLAKLLPGATHHPYDSDMPFGPLDAVARQPMTDAEALQQLLGDGARFDGPTANKLVSKKSSAKGATLQANNLIASTVPQASDLAESEDVQLTDSIRAKAAELGNDPVKIYNWVYNTIRFVTSYGSIQGAAYTLETKVGNAFDTASLLISLLRAANVPARYRYGTVWMPIEQVNNWVGGVEVREAAHNLLSQGGIPNSLIHFDGVPTYFGLEHVWVEAYGDFPSTDTAQTGARWHSLDAAYKQYQFKKGIDLKQAVPFDGEGFANNLLSRATVNEAEGWVQNVDQSYIQSQMDSYRQQVENYITNTIPTGTVGDVLGGQTIVERTNNQLEANLPYSRIVASAAISNLPDNLRHKFKFELLDQTGSAVLFSVTRSTPQLAGRSLALSFSPATPADEDILKNYLPQNPDSPDDLPNSIPANLFKLKAEFSIDGQTVITQGGYGIGTELSTRKGFWTPRFGWETTDNPVIVGEYQAVGMDLHGIAQSQIDKLRLKIEATKAKLEAGIVNDLGKHSITGAILQAGVQSYMAMTHVQNQLAAKPQGVTYFREPSYGTFSSTINIQYWFGQPRNVMFSGFTMDIDRMKHSAESIINCWDQWTDFNRTSGIMLSALEHVVPEQLFDTVEKKADGVSAVKALALASAQGQKIYVLDSSKAAVLHTLNIDAQAKSEMQKALEDGKVVTVHESIVDYKGWKGSGYLMIDPESGAGAYKIAGGSNGGIMADMSSFLSGALLGFVDGETSRTLSMSVINSDKLLLLQRFAKNSAALGALTLIISIFQVLNDDSLSWTDKLGQIALNLLGFAATNYIVASVSFFFAGTVPVFAGIMALAISIALSIAIKLVMVELFSWRLLRNRSADIMIA